ncbi:hypothetical protein PAEPH01_0392 [Pancytospora epiphaga]|nr:hypothetical protein PAEPH01_0392 [Pancytospora epiphaga]
MEENFSRNVNNLEELLTSLLVDSKPSISYIDASNICFTCTNKPKLLKRLCKYIRNITSNALSDAFNNLSTLRPYSEIFEVFLEDYADGHVGTGTSTFLSDESTRAWSILNDILDLDVKYSRFIGMATEILLPIDTRVRFMDRHIGKIEKSYRGVMHNSSRKHRDQFVCGIATMLLYVKAGARMDLLYPNIKRIFHFLRVYGVKRYCLRTVRKILAGQDRFILKDSVDDYELVKEYFRKRKEQFGVGIYTGVESQALKGLYAQHDISKILKILKSTVVLQGASNDEIERNNTMLLFVYYIFYKAGLLDRLLEAYITFLNTKASDRLVYELHAIYMKNSVVLYFLNDKKFLTASENYYNSICDDPLNIKYISDWVDTSLRRIDLDSMDLFKFVIFIIQKSKTPETILDILRVNLGNRLINKKSIIKNEYMFLEGFRRMYSRNMYAMIEDTITSKWITDECSAMEEENGCLLMKLCKWPEYKAEDVGTFELMKPIELHRSRIEKELKDKGKRVRWLDVLSRVNIEVFGRRVEVTLFQLSILLKLAGGNGEVDDKEEKRPKVVVSGEINKGEILSVPSIYQGQFKLLLNAGIVQFENGCYKLSSNFKGVSFVPGKYEESGCSGDMEDSFDISTSKAVLESRVMSAMKKKKKVSKEELLKLVPAGDNVLEELIEKGYIEIERDIVLYIP